MTATQQTQFANNVPTVECVSIRPEMALRWLEISNTNNRKVSDQHVHRLARDMSEGKWRLTHAGIAFDSNGILLDGQHRLWAITMAGVTVEMYVWRNVAPEVLMTIDCGKTRSMADILNIAGKNGEVTHQHLATLRSMLGGFVNSPSLSPAETSLALRTHHDAIAFAIENLPVVGTVRGVSTATTRAVIARAWYSVDHDQLAQFCRVLSTGMIENTDDTIIIKLRDQLMATGSLRNRTIQKEFYGKIECVLLHWLHGETRSILRPVRAEHFMLPEEVVD
tara:strand:- start:27 stop:863 length:837 start_codon:yes stop_codon:yes gene_type:complete